MKPPAPRRQPYANPAGQPTNPYPPAVQPTGNAVELYGDREATVYVPSAENPSVMVGVLKRHVQPMQPTPARDLAPQPLFDPTAQRLLAAGLGGGGLLWGGGQLFAGLSKVLAAATGTSFFVLCLIFVGGRVLFAFGSRAAGGNTYNNEIHVEQKWFGRNDIDIHNN